MKTPTKQKIINYLSVRGLVSGTELESQAREWETKASVISRRCRDLEREGRIEKSYSLKHTVQYKLPQRDTFDPNEYLKDLAAQAQEKQGILF